MDAVLFSSTAEPVFNDEKPECSPALESWHQNVDLDEILYRMIMDDLRHSAWHVVRCLVRKNNPFARNEVRSPKTEVKLRFMLSNRNPFARNERQKLG